MGKILAATVLLATLVAFSGCSNVGTNFDVNLVNQIQNGKTTQAEISSMFGTPYKKGIQNGHPIWVYEYNQYRAGGKKTSKDLTVLFNDDGVVRTTQFMTTGDKSGMVAADSGAAPDGPFKSNCINCVSQLK